MVSTSGFDFLNPEHQEPEKAIEIIVSAAERIWGTKEHIDHHASGKFSPRTAIDEFEEDILTDLEVALLLDENTGVTSPRKEAILDQAISEQFRYLRITDGHNMQLKRKDIQQFIKRVLIHEKNTPETGHQTLEEEISEAIKMEGKLNIMNTNGDMFTEMIRKKKNIIDNKRPSEKEIFTKCIHIIMDHIKGRTFDKIEDIVNIDEDTIKILGAKLSDFINNYGKKPMKRPALVKILSKRFKPAIVIKLGQYLDLADVA